MQRFYVSWADVSGASKQILQLYMKVQGAAVHKSCAKIATAAEEASEFRCWPVLA